MNDRRRHPRNPCPARAASPAELGGCQCLPPAALQGVPKAAEKSRTRWAWSLSEVPARARPSPPGPREGTFHCFAATVAADEPPGDIPHMLGERCGKLR